MTLVDDYLRAVALLLPKAQREDIAAELRDTLLTRIEAREAEFGRALSENETQVLLREVGHPLVVAARYREGPQHVVGPTLYPYWAFAVKVAVTLQVAIAGVVFLIQSLTGGDMALAFDRALAAALTGSASLIGVATAVAWIVERRNIRIGYLDRWRVRDLRGLEILSWEWGDWSERLAGSRIGSRSRRGVRLRASKPGRLAGRALGEIAFGTVLVLWWIGAIHIPLAVNSAELTNAGIDLGALAVDWTALKAALFWPVLILGLAIAAQGALILLRPRASVSRGLSDIAIGAGELALTAWIWTTSSLAPAIRVDSVAAFVARTRTVFHDGAPIDLAALLMIGLFVAAMVAVGRVMRGVWEIWAPSAGLDASGQIPIPTL